uniref:Uncharacterized protein n=1 Tax=Neobodo designis TaxID=312471 RepID=A0A7S1Q1D7_NEODS|mmetsp:Transcript_26581/g.82166  ORF Transcript_26581/g.82166 Transcript_26581/m.82166 type:complete len:294 (+) Transcript_26581:329-1210(+)|eukprot:CAMPEP_0174852840 /NCGR_PEP_ID=MMETSP1114-20130205/26973_1 /TAXON_ID=312471 /ORGANISM="Neobodo designis, Strain CCAP 1951/1" /LENGTH=293 /DNA_ID=CAMNT_0016087457 /DNA_START=329 /DNA_END=1210 /DNA_ORIENTATION=+
MGCGGSKDDSADRRRENDDKYRGKDGASPQDSKLKTSRDDPDLEDDDAGAHSPLARKESAAVNATEPGDFVAKMKAAYHVRKAKFNGANEDVDQYADEIKDSIPVLARRERLRIQEWVNEVGEANPGDAFEEIPADGKLPRPTSVATTPALLSASDAGSNNDPKSPLGMGKQTSSVAAVGSGTVAFDPGSPMKGEQSETKDEQDNLPGQVPGDEKAVPLLHVTSGSTHPAEHAKATTGQPRSRSSRRASMATEDASHNLDVSEGASANPEDATQSQGAVTDSDVVENADFKFD